MTLIKKVAVLFLTLLISTVAYSEDVTLAWDANIEPDLAGYNIHMGDRSGDYDTIFEVGEDETEITITGLKVGSTYYFAATAFDEDGRESAYSEELIHTPEQQEIEDGLIGPPEVLPDNGDGMIGPPEVFPWPGKQTTTVIVEDKICQCICQ